MCEGQGLKPSRNNCVFKCVFFKHNTSACLKCHKLCWTIKYLRTSLLNLMAWILNVHNSWYILLNEIRSLKCIFKRSLVNIFIVNSYSYSSSFHESFMLMWMDGQIHADVCKMFFTPFIYKNLKQVDPFCLKGQEMFRKLMVVGLQVVYIFM